MCTAEYPQSSIPSHQGVVDALRMGVGCPSVPMNVGHSCLTLPLSVGDEVTVRTSSHKECARLCSCGTLAICMMLP